MDKSVIRTKTVVCRIRIAAVVVSAVLPVTLNKVCVYRILSAVKPAPIASDVSRLRLAKHTDVSRIANPLLARRIRRSRVLIVVGVAFKASFVILIRDDACLNVESVLTVSCAR